MSNWYWKWNCWFCIAWSFVIINSDSNFCVASQRRLIIREISCITLGIPWWNPLSFRRPLFGCKMQILISSIGPLWPFPEKSQIQWINACFFRACKSSLHRTLVPGGDLSIPMVVDNSLFTSGRQDFHGCYMWNCPSPRN